jgi:hypothetical protein
VLKRKTLRQFYECKGGKELSKVAYPGFRRFLLGFDSKTDIVGEFKNQARFEPEFAVLRA